MKSAIQTGLLLLIGVAMIGGITFVAHYNSTNRPGAVLPSKSKPAPALAFLTTSAQWDAQNPAHAAEYEVHQRGHHDFWFEKRQPGAMALQVATKSPACTELRVGIGSAEAWRTYQTWSQTAGPSWCLATGGKAPDLLSPVGMVNWARALQWRELATAEGTETLIPAEEASSGPVVGVVRVGWKVGKLGSDHLRIDLTTRQPPDAEPALIKLRVPIQGVLPFRVYPASVDLGELNPNGPPATTTVWCWSATRDHFSLSAQEAASDPCFIVSCSPLNREEQQTLTRMLATQQVQTHVRSAYRVEITAHPHRSAQEQMDLGPFQREVRLTTGANAAPLQVSINGSVRSEFVVGVPEDKGRINLGNIKSSVGTAKVVLLSTEIPGVQLQVDTVHPDFLRVKLEEVRQPMVPGKKRWRLHLEVPPHRLAGPVPANSAIILKTLDDSPRRLRIPILGHAYP